MGPFRMRRVLPHALLGVAFALGTPFCRAQVDASLVAEATAVHPGSPITVALHLVHKKGWHTYWVNPGTGLATSLKWSLPKGWTAGPIEWPAPIALTDSQGASFGNGYEGDLLLPVTLTPPADLPAGSKIELTAEASWLMCKDQCVPGDAKVSLTLPVVDSQPAPDATWSGRIQGSLARVPHADPDWGATATRGESTVTLTVTGRPGAEPAAHAAGGLHFFSEDGTIASDVAQTAVVDAAHAAYVLTLPLSPDTPKDLPRLVGVLTSQEGWKSDGSEPGIRIDVPLAATAAPPALVTGHAATKDPAPASAPAPGGLLGTLVLAFLGGLILNLMPCVFPVLGIKILGFVNQAGADKRKVTLHGLVFAGGVLVSFWVLAAILSVLRAGGSQLGWGFQLQSPSFVFGLAAAMLAFALNMSGVFEFGLGATGFGSSLQSKSGLLGSFLTGALATVAATPCAAPFLAPALGAALALSTVESFAIFTVIALGLSTPYLLLSAFPSAVRVLPRPGAWMETFKQAMAFPLYATVAYLVWVLAGQVTESGLLSALFGLVLVAMAVWVYGRWNSPGAPASRARFGTLACLILMASGAWVGWPTAPAANAIVWEKWSPETVERLRADNRIIYVDFTARWCATCQANKRLVFHSAEVLQAFHDRNIAALEGDWTNKDASITAELAKYGRAAVPFNLIWMPGRAEPVILPEILNSSVVLGSLPK